MRHDFLMMCDDVLRRDIVLRCRDETWHCDKTLWLDVMRRDVRRHDETWPCDKT